MATTKERLFKIALKISDLEQFKNDENQELLTNLKKYFELLAADLDQLEGPSFFDEYLLFTANRDAYQLYECLQIEKSILKDLKVKIIALNKASLN